MILLQAAQGKLLHRIDPVNVRCDDISKVMVNHIISDNNVKVLCHVICSLLEGDNTSNSNNGVLSITDEQQLKPNMLLLDTCDNCSEKITFLFSMMWMKFSEHYKIRNLFVDEQSNSLDHTTVSWIYTNNNMNKNEIEFLLCDGRKHNGDRVFCSIQKA